MSESSFFLQENNFSENDVWQIIALAEKKFIDHPLGMFMYKHTMQKITLIDRFLL
jgi:hypothetical protein